MAENKSKKKLEDEEDEIAFSLQKKSVILFACAILMFLVVLYPGENLWTVIHLFFRGLFGILAIVCPCVLTYLGIVTAFEMKISPKFIRLCRLVSIAVWIVATLIFLFGNGRSGLHENYFRCIARMFVNARKDFSQGSLSGIIGCLFGYPLAFLFGFTVSEIMCVLALGIFLMFIFGITTKDILLFLHKIANKILQFIRHYIPKGSLKNKLVSLFSRDDDDDDEEDIITEDVITEDFSKQFADAKQKKNKDRKFQELFDDEQTATVSKKELPQPHAELKKEEVSEKEKPTTKKQSRKQELAKAEKDIQQQIVRSFQEENDTSDYRYPEFELLDDYISREDYTKAQQEMERNESKLDSTLKSFGVNAEIVNICRGPSVTRFEVKPAPGVKISKITNLSDDIALNLAASGVRIEAPIPGKSAVGIEIPNKVTTMVTMRELIESEEFRKQKSKLSVVLGKDISGNVITADLAKMPHLLIAGTTGSGKSVCVNSILISLLYKASPQDVKMVLIDPKMVEFTKYKGIPHLLIDVVTDPKKAAGALNWAVNEMETRYQSFALYGVRDIYGYNKMVEHYNKKRAEMTEEELAENPPVNADGIEIPAKKMHNVIVAIDEFADLMMTAPNEVEEAICRLAQKARAAGMHLVVATQRPTVNVITGLIKANIPSRIALKVSSQLDSRTILDMGGAEKLIGRGDMLFAPIGVFKPIRVQGCFASDEEIERVTDYIKNAHTPQYDSEIEEEINTITEQGFSKNSSSSNDNNDVGVGTDELTEEAIKLVLETGQASTSMLQRRFRLGYARAGRLIDEMEQLGVVGPHMGSKSREVLMTYQDWLEKRNELMNNNQQEDSE